MSANLWQLVKSTNVVVMKFGEDQVAEIALRAGEGFGDKE